MRVLYLSHTSYSYEANGGQEEEEEEDEEDLEGFVAADDDTEALEPYEPSDNEEIISCVPSSLFYARALACLYLTVLSLRSVTALGFFRLWCLSLAI